MERIWASNESLRHEFGDVNSTTTIHLIMNIIKKAIRSIALRVVRATEAQKRVDYKIGNLKHQNACIDTFSPMLVEIGDDFVSAPGSVILSHDASTFMHSGKYRVERTVIGDKVFLGANAVILPGVRVGDGAIIGAGAVVTKDVEPDTVVAGNPARRMCTVDKYMAKSEARGCLHQPPEAYEILRQDGRPSYSAKVQFQQEILKRLEQLGE